MEEKVNHAKELIRQTIEQYNRVAIACSFGKDSMTIVHLAKQVDPTIKVFSIMTVYKPKETFEYLYFTNRKMNLNTTVYIVAPTIPEELQDKFLKVVKLPYEEFNRKAREIESQTSMPIYQANPDECCHLLKVEPTKVAVKDLDAWICGLRSTEGRTRTNYQEVEDKGGLIKVNPILTWTEAEVWRYIATRGITPHPWYRKGYRSLGCAPCSNPGGEFERDGRWEGTSKCGGECGIHTKNLKNT